MSFSESLAIELPLGLVILVFILFEIKQMLADFVLQNSCMAMGKQKASGELSPFLVCCAVHSAFTLAIVLAINPVFWWLAFVDFTAHFSVDFAKARIGLATGWTPDRQNFWSLFGADQACHSLTHLVLALTLIAA